MSTNNAFIAALTVGSTLNWSAGVSRVVTAIQVRFHYGQAEVYVTTETASGSEQIYEVNSLAKDHARGRFTV